MPYQALPAKADLNVTPTTGQYKAALGLLYDAILGLFGANATPASAFDAMKLLDPQALYNLGMAPTVGANALTMTVKSRDAAAALSASNPGFVSQRSATPGSGLFNQRQLSADIALTISSGSTLGHLSAVASGIYWYVIDNAGVQELACSTTFFGQSGLVSTTAEGGAGGADSALLMYSATARASVPYRCIGRTTDTQAVAGTWAAVPTLVEGVPPDVREDRLPTGAVFFWAKPTPPDWALERNGAAGLSRTSYADLFTLLAAPAAFTVTIATPAVFTRVSHGYKAGSKIRLTTTGALPTGLAAGTNYFVIAAGLTADAFEVSATAFGAAVNTSGTQSDVHTVLDHSVLGPGNGTTTFDLPDDRGEFDRGWDDGRGVDASRVFGSAQADDLKSHTHPAYNTTQGTQAGGSFASPYSPITTTGATGGPETRPRNRAYLPCIAY